MAESCADVHCSVHADVQVLCLHCAAPHCKDPVAIVAPYKVESARDEVQVAIECGRCGSNSRQQMKAPLYLIGAIAIAFHSAHEGHPIQIQVEGHLIRSPNYPVQNLVPVLSKV